MTLVVYLVSISVRASDIRPCSALAMEIGAAKMGVASKKPIPAVWGGIGLVRDMIYIAKWHVGEGIAP